nr:hypothetical protein [Tanacetum cinerariifolium]
MSYPRFTKVIIYYFMKKNLLIPRRNKMFWYTARDDPMFTTIKVVFKHWDTQIYGTILLKNLTNQAMIESEAYKTYYAYATDEKTPKLKYVKKKADSKATLKKNPTQATNGKRLKATAKVAKSGKKKLPAKGLETLSDVALTEAEQMKLITKRSKTDYHISHASGSCADEGTSVSPAVPDVKVQVKEQVSKILPKIKKLVNDHLEAEVLIRSSNQAKTSHDVAANLSKHELKKILIDKMENNKSIDRLILSRLNDVEMMRMKMKNPPLDQTEGPREKGAWK